MRPGLQGIAALAGVALVAVAVIANAAPSTQSGDWQFRVLLDNKEIGYHNFSISEDQGATVLKTEARFDVKVLFVTAFRYRHENKETWNADCLAGIEASTNSNGKTLTVRGRRSEDAFAVESSTGVTTLPDCIQSFAYWNPAILQARQLLNSQTGAYEDVTVTSEGSDTVRVGGASIPAERYRLSAAAGDITLWYSSDDALWLALEAPAKGGRRIRYEPVSLPAPETRGT